MTSVSKRRYSMGARAAAAEITRQRIIEAADALFAIGSYDEVGLQAVAERAGVTEKTVLRKFGSKERLAIAVARSRGLVEERSRHVAPGDVDAVVRVLASRYEAEGDLMWRYVAVEDRIAIVGRLVQDARLGHWDWLARAFARYLPRRRGPLHRQRVAELFAATELYVWRSWRRLGLSRAQAERAMSEMLKALVADWGHPEVSGHV